MLQRYLWGPDGAGADEPLAQDDGTAAGNQWFLADRNGDITDVVSADGTELNHIVYDSFGNVVNQTDPTALLPRFGFAGMVYDANTGMDYDNARYYDPVTGRFINQDPLGFGGGTANTYEYANNDPTSESDPSGLDPNFGLTVGLNVPVGPPKLNFADSPEKTQGNIEAADAYFAQLHQNAGDDPATNLAIDQQAAAYWGGGVQAQHNWDEQTAADAANQIVLNIQADTAAFNLQILRQEATANSNDDWYQAYDDQLALRLGGVLQATGGAIEFGSGVLLSSSLVGASVGGPFALHGLDNYTAGLATAWGDNPNPTQTYTEYGVSQAAQYFGASRSQGDLIGGVTNGAIGLGSAFGPQIVGAAGTAVDAVSQFNPGNISVTFDSSTLGTFGGNVEITYNAAENTSSSLNILNPNFEPDPVAILQNHVDAANAALTANPLLARSFLSPAEYAQFQTSGGYALNYGKAIERLTASDVANNPLSNSLFDYVGGPNEPDFVGRANTVADPFQFDVTTPSSVPAHFTRPYGPDTYMITYQRP